MRSILCILFIFGVIAICYGEDYELLVSPKGGTCQHVHVIRVSDKKIVEVTTLEEIEGEEDVVDSKIVKAIKNQNKGSKRYGQMNAEEKSMYKAMMENFIISKNDELFTIKAKE